MFNFLKDSTRSDINSDANLGLNATLPRWGVLFSTKNYALVWPN